MYENNLTIKLWIYRNALRFFNVFMSHLPRLWSGACMYTGTANIELSQNLSFLHTPADL